MLMVCNTPVLGHISITFLSGVTVGFSTNNYRDNENKGYIIVTCTASGPVFNDVTLNIKDSPNTALSQLLIYTILLLVHDIYY